jgi:hypothetical protein
VPGFGPVTRSGGLLAQRSNSGSFSDTSFAVVPELNLRVGWKATEHVSVSAGYTFLYWSSVSRAGDQIDARVNPTQIPPGLLSGPARPAFVGKDTDFWAQGVSGGVTFSW